MGMLVLFFFIAGALAAVAVMTPKWVSLFFWLVLADLVLSTVYYNYIDRTTVELEHRFVNGDWGGMNCSDPYRDSWGNMQRPECGGGILVDRDQYFATKHVITHGGWQNDGWILWSSTFRPYFTWGL